MHAGFFISERIIMSAIVQNQALLEALRAVVDLPESIVSLKLTMSVEEVPIIECQFHPVRDVTNLQSTAVEYRLDHGMTVTQRFVLCAVEGQADVAQAVRDQVRVAVRHAIP